MKVKTIGILLFLAGIAGVLVLDNCWEIFINLPAAAYVILAAGGLALVKLRKGDGPAGFFRHVKRYVIISGVLACLTGVLQMALSCSNTRVFSPAEIFIGFAAAAIAVFYALILYLLIDAFTA